MPKIDSLDNEIKKSASKIEGLKKDISAKSAEITNNKADIDPTKTHTEAVLSELEKRNKNAKEKQEKIKELEKHLTDAKNRITEIENKAISTVGISDEDKKLIETETDRAVSRLEKIQNSFNNVATKAESIGTKVDQAKRLATDHIESFEKKINKVPGVNIETKDNDLETMSEEELNNELDNVFTSEERKKILSQEIQKRINKIGEDNENNIPNEGDPTQTEAKKGWFASAKSYYDKLDPKHKKWLTTALTTTGIAGATALSFATGGVAAAVGTGITMFGTKVVGKYLDRQRAKEEEDKNFVGNILAKYDKLSPRTKKIIGISTMALAGAAAFGTGAGIASVMGAGKGMTMEVLKQTMLHRVGSGVARGIVGEGVRHATDKVAGRIEEKIEKIEAEFDQILAKINAEYSAGNLTQEEVEEQVAEAKSKKESKITRNRLAYGARNIVARMVGAVAGGWLFNQGVNLGHHEPTTTHEETKNPPETKPVPAPTINQPEIPPVTQESTIDDDAFIRKGEGIWHVLKRQLDHNPELQKAYHYDPNASSHERNLIIAKLEKEFGYTHGSDEVRVKWEGEHTVGYQLSKDGAGIKEFHMEGGKLVNPEGHGMGSEFEDRSKQESYEYGSKHNVHSTVHHNTSETTNHGDHIGKENPETGSSTSGGNEHIGKENPNPTDNSDLNSGKDQINTNNNPKPGSSHVEVPAGGKPLGRTETYGHKFSGSGFVPPHSMYHDTKDYANSIGQGMYQNHISSDGHYMRPSSFADHYGSQNTMENPLTSSDHFKFIETISSDRQGVNSWYYEERKKIIDSLLANSKKDGGEELTYYRPNGGDDVYHSTGDDVYDIEPNKSIFTYTEQDIKHFSASKIENHRDYLANLSHRSDLSPIDKLEIKKEEALLAIRTTEIEEEDKFKALAKAYRKAQNQAYWANWRQNSMYGNGGGHQQMPNNVGQNQQFYKGIAEQGGSGITRLNDPYPRGQDGM